jgi:hypothetical protein
MSAQVRLDAVIIAAGRFLTSPDIGFRSPVTGLVEGLSEAHHGIG